ncbi:hypothetical protein DFH08DRAFT_411475 [Mycena albidolilacea]|uniref:Transmembrane protein n=1 Tax=Mycena albidolilacea TaxID=1033008 RepID=A0AAD7AIS6_9AGAR|nr:hypothetical protein DFH08DRAFT_411475 [Mycena albidolilacea]
MNLFNTASNASFGTLATSVEASGLTKTVSLPSFPGLRVPSGWFIQFVSTDGGSEVLSASQTFSVDPTFGETHSVSVHGSTVSATQTPTSLPSTASPTSSGMSSTSMVSPSTAPPSGFSKKKNLSGPIAGAVVGGLIVAFAAGIFVLCRARRRTQRTSLLPLANPLTLGTWTPAHRFNILPGETAPPTRAVTHEIPAVQEKARNPVQLQQQIRELTERAEAQGLAQSTFRPETVQPYDANAQLLEEIRMLKSQMSAIQQQQQHIQAVMDQGLPEYTSSPT